MPRCRTALFLLALGTASALPVVELQKDVYEVALKEVGTPWLIEIYSGMCASCKAYADIWHGVEAKVLQNTKVAVGRINICLLYTSPSPRDQRGSRMPSSA